MDLDDWKRLIVAQILQPFVDGKVSPLAGIETAWEATRMAVSDSLECGKGARKDRHIGTCNSSAKDIGESRQERWVQNKGRKKQGYHAKVIALFS